MTEKRRVRGPREVGATMLLALRRNKSNKKMLLAVMSRGREEVWGLESLWTLESVRAGVH